MKLITPAEFLREFCAPFTPQDHHHTGAQQAEGQGSVTHEEGTILAAYARRAGGPALEIGADLGISSRYIDEGLNGGRLISVDPMHKWNAGEGGWPNIQQIAACSIDGKIPALPYTFAFVDGDHRYFAVIRDISVCIAAGCDELFFHDVSPYFDGRPTNSSDGSEARAAVQDYLGNLPDEWELWDITTRCGLCFARRR